MSSMPYWSLLIDESVRLPAPSFTSLLFTFVPRITPENVESPSPVTRRVAALPATKLKVLFTLPLSVPTFEAPELP